MCPLTANDVSAFIPSAKWAIAPKKCRAALSYGCVVFQVSRAALAMGAMLLWLLPGTAAALVTTQRVSVYHPAERITSLVQSEDGFLWVGSDLGLLRFDGKTFITPSAAPELRQPITALSVTPTGSLLAAVPWPPRVLERRASQPDRFVTWDFNFADKIVAIAAKQATTYVLTPSKLYEGTATTLKEVTLPGLAGPFLALAVARDEAVWLAGLGGVWRRDKVGNTTRVMEHATNVLAARTSGMLLGTEAHGLWRADITGENAEAVPGAELDPTILSFSQDDDGSVVVGTGRGLAQVEGERALLLAADNAQFPSTRFLSVLVDKEGNVWAGTDGGGLVTLAGSSLVRAAPNPSAPTPFSFTLAAAAGGSQWGTGDGSFLVQWRGNDAVVHRPPAALPAWDYRSLVVDSGGMVWVTSLTSGLFSFDPGKRQFTSYAERLPGVPKSLHAVFAVHDGLWLSLRQGGLVELQRSPFALVGSPKVACTSMVTWLLEDDEGDLYASTDGDGLCVRRKGSSDFERFATRPSTQGMSLLALAKGEAGRLWIGTRRDGLLRLQNNEVSRIGFDHGLGTDHVPQLTPDGGGHLWIPTRNGLMRVSEREANAVADRRQEHLTPFVLTTADGLLSNECNWGWPSAVVRAGDGAIWAATRKGVAVVDHPASLALPKAKGILFDKILLDGQRLAARPDGQRVRSHEGTLSVAFALPALSAGNRVRFAHRLHGHSEWSQATKEGSAEFTGVSPGSYVFEVKAFYEGLEDEIASARLPLTLTPPIYRAWWFILSAMMAIGVAIASGAKRRARRRAAQQAAVVAERARIARDIHDTLEQTFVAIRFQAAAAARQIDASVQAQQNLARVLTLVERGVAETRAAIWSLQSSNQPAGLVKALRNLAAHTLQGTNVAYSFAVEGSEVALPADVQVQVVRIMGEALANALKHAAASEIAMTVTFDAAEMRIGLRDDGRGFDARAPAPQDHYGLQNIHSRAAALGGKAYFDSAPGQGTYFRLVIPQPIPTTARHPNHST